MGRHFLKLAKTARFYDRKDITLDDVTFTFKLYTHDNASGFVHFAELLIDYDEIANAKAQYYNRTWEKYTGQSVYKQAVEWALKSKDITKQQYDKLKEALE